MKHLLCLIAGVAVGYMIHGCSAGGSSTDTFNDTGKKIVISSCSKEQDCLISIGQSCEDTGYKVLTHSYDNESGKTVITAQCGAPKKTGLFSL